MTAPGAIIVGASSGIGRALAIALSNEGYRLGVVARRTALLEQLQTELAASCAIRTVDVSTPEAAMPLLQELIDELGDVSLFIINAGIGFDNPSLEWELERATIGVNVLGFAGMANTAAKHLESRGSGHIVGITSVAGLRGIGGAPAYSASKAFMSTYLQALRYRFRKMKLPVVVTDVRPGFVDTAMGQSKKRFWVATPDVAARQIVAAIRRRSRYAYVTRRWRLAGWVMRLLPEAIYSRL